MNKKYSRTLIYSLSAVIMLGLAVLGLYITPLIIVLFGGIWSFYIFLSIASLGLGFLFKTFLEKSSIQSKDFVIFPMILSTIAIPYFGFLKI